MKVYNILQEYEYICVVRPKAVLESTGEEIEDLLCPCCDSEIEVIDTAKWGDYISVTYYCASCDEIFEDGLLCESKYPHLLP
jgi:hypothetical protein